MQEFDQNKFALDLVNQFSKPVFEGVKKIGEEGFDKFKVILNTCFKKYINRNYERYSKTKTLLYRDSPVNLKDFYVRTDLTLGENKLVKECNFIEEVETNQRIIISGTAGTGKSTFCKSIFLDLVENPIGIFPIFIELRHLNSSEGSTLYDFVLETLMKVESKFTKSQLDYSIKLGKVMLIFDGFDEIDIDKRDKYEAEITNLANNHENIIILVSSRPDTRFTSWEEFFLYKVCALDKPKALELVEKLEYDIEIKTSFIKALEETLFEQHSSFASNPLLLTMMLLTYEQFAEIPNKIHLFYEQAFLTLFNMHDSLKSLYKRKSSSGLPLDEFKKVLSSFCILSYLDKKYSFSYDEANKYIENAIQLCRVKTNISHFFKDLLDNVCMIQKDGIGYTFTHRSFQEYFTALYLVSMANENRFEIFDNIFSITIFDDVTPMAFDINCDLLEQEWIIPKLEKLVEDFSTIPNTNAGKLMVFSKMTYGVTVRKDYAEVDKGAQRITIHSRSSINDYSSFIYCLRKLYDERHVIYNSTKGREKGQKKKLEAHAEFIRMDLKKNNFLIVNDLSKLSQATKDRLFRTGCCDNAIRKIDYARQKLTSLKTKHSENQKEISLLLLGR